MAVYVQLKLTVPTVRRWCNKFGPQFAAGLRRTRPRTGDKWHLDEVFLKINGGTHYWWRLSFKSSTKRRWVIHGRKSQ